jgi:hypothetical protein
MVEYNQMRAFRGVMVDGFASKVVSLILTRLQPGVRSADFGKPF